MLDEKLLSDPKKTCSGKCRLANASPYSEAADVEIPLMRAERPEK
jgi:hypothetical protein